MADHSDGLVDIAESSRKIRTARRWFQGRAKRWSPRWTAMAVRSEFERA